MHEACLIAGGSLPTLAKGADDIFWVHQLQDALVAEGYYPDEDEMGDWYFGDHTANALSMFQACTCNSGTHSCNYKLVTVLHLLTLICSSDCNVIPAGALKSRCLYQAGKGLPETGVCDVATWRALLGDHGLSRVLQQAPGLVRCSVPSGAAMMVCVA